METDCRIVELQCESFANRFNQETGTKNPNHYGWGLL
jgi:hypothetical protein